MRLTLNSKISEFFYKGRIFFTSGCGRFAYTIFLASFSIEDHQGSVMKLLSNLCFVLGLASVLGSIAIWYYAGGKAVGFEARTHGELFGIFVGLWAPTFLILSNRLARYVEEKK